MIYVRDADLEVHLAYEVSARLDWMPQAKRENIQRFQYSDTVDPRLPEITAVAEMIRDITTSDLDWAYALNEQHAAQLSSVTKLGFAELVERTAYARVIDDEAAFLLAFDQDADYDSTNFVWFKERIDRFVYVDRIAVSSAYRRKGLARLLYENLFQFTEERGEGRVVCEVNAEPPNPVSDAFHKSLGFTVLGRRALPDRGRVVTYLGRELNQTC